MWQDERAGEIVVTLVIATYAGFRLRRVPTTRALFVVRNGRLDAIISTLLQLKSLDAAQHTSYNRSRVLNDHAATELV